MKKRKPKIYIGWVHSKDIYHDFGNRYVATGTVIYKKKRFDTPYKIKITEK